MARGWRGGRESRGRSDSSESPAWKQSRRRAANADGSLRWGLIAVASLLLFILVGLAIWIFVIPDRFATSFNLVTVRNPAGALDAVQLQWPGLVNQEPAVQDLTADNAVLRNLKVPAARSSLFDRWSEGLNAVREETRYRDSDHEILILYLQTGLVSNSANKIQVLSGRGSPDLEADDTVSLESVKEAISKLVEERENVSVLLLLDTPPLRDSLRYGSTGNTGITECLKWPEEISGLAVIAACGDQEISWPGSIHFKGQTAFAHFVNAALSTDADANSDQLIDVNEFFGYLQAGTQEWVTAFRGPELQHVTRDSTNTNFVVVKSPGTPPEQKLLSAIDDPALRRIEATWKHCQQINDRCGSRFAPIPLRIAVDYLQAAEESFLSGDFETANSLCRIAETVYLTAADAELKTQPGTDVQSRSDLSTDGQLPRIWFKSTPAFSRISNSWTAPSEDASGDTEPTPLPSWEQIIRTEADARTTDNETRKKFLADQRARAELTAAQTFGGVHMLESLMSKADTEILDVEDSFFAAPNVDSGDPKSIETILNVITETARERRLSESLLADVQPLIPGLLEWCSTAAHVEKDSDTALLLSDNFQRRDAGSLWDRMPPRQQISAKDEPAVLNKELANETLRILLCSRVLQQLLFQTPVPDALSPLQEHHGSLAKWRTRLDESYRQTQALGKSLVSNAIGEDGKKAIPGSNLRAHYQATRGLLKLTFVSAEDRTAILRMVANTDIAMAQNKTPLAEESPFQPCFLASGNQSAVRWKAQILTFLPQDKVPVKTLDELFERGYEISDVWKSVRRELMTPPDDSTKTQQLGNAEFLCRVLPVYDCMTLWDKRKNLLTKSLLDRYLHDYRDLHVKRLLTGGWISGKSPDWYFKTAEKWAGDDRACQERLKARSTGKWSASLKSPLAPSVVKLTDGKTWYGRGVIEFPEPKLFQGKATFLVTPTTADPVPSGLHLMANGTPLDEFSALISIGQESIPVPNFNFKVTQSATEAELSQAVDYGVSLYFRGRHQQLGAIQVDPREGRSWEVVRRIPPENGAVYLETTDTRPIAFVFDWSGSMKTVRGNAVNTRAAEALEAMRKVISLQDPFCPGSLRVFGHRLGLSSPNPDFAKHFQGFKFPDQSIEPPDDPQKDSQQLVPLTRLNDDGQKAFDDVLKRLEKSQPFGATPLLYSLCRAITQDLQYQPGVVVAITDGAATDLDNMDELIQLLKGSGGRINVLVIMFDINANEEKESITKLFARDGLKQWCTVKDAKDNDGIIRALDEFRKPPVFRLENAPLEPIQITAEKERNRFQYMDDQIPAGNSYQLLYQDVKTKDNILLEFKAGDTQKMQVDWRNNEFLFMRPPAVASAEFRGSSGEDRLTPSRLSAISTAKRNGVDSSLEVDLMLTGDDSSLPVKTPEEVEFWFEADSAPGQQFHRSEERLLQDSNGMLIGTPAWRIRLQDWPRSNVRVNAVCRMTRTRPDHVFKWSEIVEHNGPDKLLHHPASGELPNADLWYRKLPDKLQIRLDVPDGSPESAKELPDVRIEIGKRDATNREFYPDRVNSVCRRFESGSVVWEFEGDWTDDKLAEREIALTSRTTRQNGALVLKQPLSIPTEIINP